MNRIEEYQQKITNALKDSNRWAEALWPQVRILASTFVRLELLDRALCELDSILIANSQGEKIHPVFHALKEVDDSATRQMKSLGLTAEQLHTEVVEDKLGDAIEMVAKAKGVIIRPNP